MNRTLPTFERVKLLATTPKYESKLSCSRDTASPPINQKNLFGHSLDSISVTRFFQGTDFLKVREATTPSVEAVVEQLELALADFNLDQARLVLRPSKEPNSNGLQPTGGGLWKPWVQLGILSRNSPSQVLVREKRTRCQSKTCPFKCDKVSCSSCRLRLVSSI